MAGLCIQVKPSCERGAGIVNITFISHFALFILSDAISSLTLVLQWRTFVTQLMTEMTNDRHSRPITKNIHLKWTARISPDWPRSACMAWLWVRIIKPNALFYSILSWNYMFDHHYQFNDCYIDFKLIFGGEFFKRLKQTFSERIFAMLLIAGFLRWRGGRGMLSQGSVLSCLF